MEMLFLKGIEIKDKNTERQDVNTFCVPPPEMEMDAENTPVQRVKKKKIKFSQIFVLVATNWGRNVDYVISNTVIRAF